VNNNTKAATAGTQYHAMTAAARIYAESNGNNTTGSPPRNRGDTDTTRGAHHTHTHRRSAPMTIVAEGVPGSVELVDESSSNRFHVTDEDEFDYVEQMQDTATVGAASVVSLEAELNSSMDAFKRERNQNRKLRSKIADCEQQIKLLQTELDSKKYSHSAKVEKIAAQRDAAMEMVKAKDRDMTELMKAINNNVSAREENATRARKEAEEALVQTREEVTTLVYENKSMKDRLHSAEERSMKLVTDNAEMKVKSTTLEAQLKVETELRGRAEQMESTERNERIAMSAQMLAMAKDHAAKEAKFKGQFEDEILELREKIEADSELMKEQEERLSMHRETITLLEEEKVSLKNALTQKDRTEVNIIEENGQLRGEVAVLKEQLKNTHAKAADMETSLNEKICSLEEKIREGEALRRRLHNTVQELRGNVRVYARVRPFLPIDGVGDDAVACITPRDESSLSIQNEKALHHFEYDHVFPASTGQEGVFEEVSEFVQSALDGYHVTLFSYGQTGSGKTHTMQGMRDQMRGIIPRAIEQVGKYKVVLEEDGWAYDMNVSMLEIYNETIRDLLRENEDSGDTKYDIKVDKEGERYVSNLTLKHIDPTNMAAIEDVMQQAAKYRSVGCTGMNQVSSRSHSVFTLHLTATHSERKQKLKGTLNLVDLAGSERLDRSGATGAQAKETAAINKSLSSLTDVFAALGKKSGHVPFRNSKLTYLLQPSFSGNGKTLMLVNLSPTEESFQESLSTLRFAKQVNQCELGKAKKSIQADVSDTASQSDAMSLASATSESSPTNTNTSSSRSSRIAKTPTTSRSTAANRASARGGTPRSSPSSGTTPSRTTTPRRPSGMAPPRTPASASRSSASSISRTSRPGSATKTADASSGVRRSATLPRTPSKHTVSTSASRSVRRKVTGADR